MKGQRTPLAPGVTPAWTHVVGSGASRVVVYEDLARDRGLTLRWWSAVRTNWQRKSLGRALERDRRGRVTDASEAWAKEQALLKSAALITGTPDEMAMAPSRFTIGQTEVVLTDDATGPYPHPTPFRAELVRALLFAGLVWGKDAPWATITDDDWTRLIRQRLAGLLTRGRQGIRGTEITVSRINTAAEYLREKKKIPRDAALLPKKWRQALLDFWRGEVKTRTGSVPADPKPARPRHTLEQLRSIIAVAGDVDPRFGLLLQLGAEYRAGQVVRAKRSALDLNGGMFTIEGRGKKLGGVVNLTDAQRLYAWQVLGWGYLCELEGAYQAGAWEDYYLFPAGKMLGRASGDFVIGDGIDLTRHAERQLIIDNFREAERRCGIAPVKGRAQYGLRRQNVDAINEAGISPLGKLAAGGWSSTDVPDAIYAESTNRVGREEAKRVRAKTRGDA